MIVSVFVMWDGTENAVDDRARPGLYDEPLGVMSIMSQHTI